MGSGNCAQAALPIANKKNVGSAKRRNHDNNIRPSGSDGCFASPFKGTPVWGKTKRPAEETWSRVKEAAWLYSTHAGHPYAARRGTPARCLGSRSRPIARTDFGRGFSWASRAPDGCQTSEAEAYT